MKLPPYEVPEADRDLLTCGVVLDEIPAEDEARARLLRHGWRVCTAKRKDGSPCDTIFLPLRPANVYCPHRPHRTPPPNRRPKP